ncbi:hypothetical protein Sliba_68830 [Streptomyces nigrescens]|uniref:Uncharacterized protein n=1 Tax=Streptomyces nigrescens TaxID=1920 RepID=A0A640TTM8_STRNI|nr:hypothetical protein Sliba_68830 [Streptomyces libani subsp. libani]GGW07312.1 hypothetical protein GCM10010500_75810 [Streptomyces libani subsp. libani]
MVTRSELAKVMRKPLDRSRSERIPVPLGSAFPQIGVAARAVRSSSSVTGIPRWEPNFRAQCATTPTDPGFTKPDPQTPAHPLKAIQGYLAHEFAAYFAPLQSRPARKSAYGNSFPPVSRFPPRAAGFPAEWGRSHGAAAWRGKCRLYRLAR